MRKFSALFITTAVALASIRVRAFDPGKAGWKMSADGKTIEMKDGHPVYVDANGTERTFEPDHITRLNGEAAGLRKRATDAEKSLEAFKDIDPTKARKAIEDIGKIDAKKLIDAGEVDKVRNEISATFTTQLNEAKSVNSTLQSELDTLRISNVFGNSSYIRENVALPNDIFQAYFSRNFKVKEGKIEAFDAAGNRLMSKKNVGDYADPEEALAILVDAHPQKATILKANNNSGSGNGGGGGNRGNGRIIKRADFDAMQNQGEKAALAGKMRTGEVTIVD